MSRAGSSAVTISVLVAHPASKREGNDEGEKACHVSVFLCEWAWGQLVGVRRASASPRWGGLEGRIL